MTRRERGRMLWLAALLLAFGPGSAALADEQEAAGKGQEAEEQAAQDEAWDEAGGPSYLDNTSINAGFMFRLENRCVYRATVRGLVTPSGPPKPTGNDRPLTPALWVDASLKCPDEPPVFVTRAVTADAPMARPDVEAALERSGTLIARDAGGRCVYAPDFVLTNNLFSSLGVTYLCSIRGVDRDR